ncbi:TOBE domain-containing protein [Rheinheimera sp.]|uniref:TOBE domain-containing protein n=1 Tax=Rheinheimera sp. TaxID=1869214 RepID=UPI002FDCD4C8
MDNLNPTFGLEADLKLLVKGQVLGGKQQVLLLSEIDKCGSITHAAKAAGVSYKTAWDSIAAMNHLAGTPLVARAIGGKGGGGSQLTERGRQLVANFQQLEAAHQRYLTDISSQTGGLLDDMLLLRRLSMKTSARNQFFGTVVSMKPGMVNSEVTLRTADGVEVVAVITDDSCQRLGLTPNAEAFALVKSSAVILLGAEQNIKTSARNYYTGRISTLVPGMVSTEVLVALSSSTSISATLTNVSAELMALCEGAPVSVAFKASSVIIAVPA